MLLQVKMAAAKIIGAVVASFAVAYVCDTLIADQKVFGGNSPAVPFQNLPSGLEKLLSPP